MSIVNLPTFNTFQWTESNGDLTTAAALYSDELNQTLIDAIRTLNLISSARVINDLNTVNRGTVVNDALIAPQKTTAEITTLASNSEIPAGSIFFDTDISKLKVKVSSGTVETITSS